MKFNIGDLVSEKDTIKAYTSYSIYEVVGVLGDHYLLEFYGNVFDGDNVKSDYVSEEGTSGWHGAIFRYKAGELFTLDEAKEELHRLEAIESALNADFEKIKAEIQDKLNAAANLVRQATKLLEPLNRDLFKLKGEGWQLHNALTQGGWY